MREGSSGPFLRNNPALLQLWISYRMATRFIPRIMAHIPIGIVGILAFPKAQKQDTMPCLNYIYRLWVD